MTGPPKYGRKSGRRPTPEELELFGRVLGDAKPLRDERQRHKPAVEAEPAPDKPDGPKPKNKKPGKPVTRPSIQHPPPPKPDKAPAALSEHDHGTAPGIDRRLQVRLKRGQLPIEASIDLHGNSRERAHALLNGFLARAQAQGLRCVLVVTGKGRPDWDRPQWGEEAREIGVIRRALPGWLDDFPNKDRVLAYTRAQPHHGGAGAWYILLRRNRVPGPGSGGGGR